MILTTTPTIEGKQIIEYKGIVFGGRSGSYEEKKHKGLEAN
ncbi:MAG: putative heavy-metal-binding [Clostridia bacterium]|jgi:uncharacterized protein YbjQ (UPF0145 family)|nr:putative heavy-metal-binding [Clostridia bacterium]